MSIQVVELDRVEIPQLWRDIVKLETGWDPKDEVVWGRESGADHWGEPLPLTERAVAMLNSH